MKYGLPSTMGKLVIHLASKLRVGKGVEVLLNVGTCHGLRARKSGRHGKTTAESFCTAFLIHPNGFQLEAVFQLHGDDDEGGGPACQPLAAHLYCTAHTEFSAA